MRNSDSGRTSTNPQTLTNAGNGKALYATDTANSNATSTHADTHTSSPTAPYPME
ncbi:hypothetical protein [Bifidobacterium aquikefiri]|uniref:hypothetical protein n=1 Tax=Bifidobacterium aquikefiri TaxID=1653207 RepID=UPI0023F47972|nr:hypothetical protein [Bifidobacterium aquikefiri]